MVKKYWLCLIQDTIKPILTITEQRWESVPTGKSPTTDYDNRRLPSLLFLGAAILTLGILIALTRPLLQVRRMEG